jgi:guanine nucleotide-binding protein subunit alpha
MFDVGGQDAERKKWIRCFESIIFCAALSEYGQILFEGSKTVSRAFRFQLSLFVVDSFSYCRIALWSLFLFEIVINSRWFVHTSVILFLKIDIFKSKLLKVSCSPIYLKLNLTLSRFTGSARKIPSPSTITSIRL